MDKYCEENKVDKKIKDMKKKLWLIFITGMFFGILMMLVVIAV